MHTTDMHTIEVRTVFVNGKPGKEALGIARLIHAALEGGEFLLQSNVDHVEVHRHPVADPDTLTPCLVISSTQDGRAREIGEILCQEIQVDIRVITETERFYPASK